MVDGECQKPAVAAEGTEAEADNVDAARENTPCLNAEGHSEQPSPLRMGNAHFMPAATLAKCSVAARKYKGPLMRSLLGISLVSIGLCIWLLDPLELYIRKLLAFHEGSYAFEAWKKPPVPIRHSVFVFNVTNADGFLHRGEKLRVEEVGPYVYSETLENIPIKFNENGTITYRPKRTETFSQEFSERNAKEDLIVVPNLTFIALISMVHKYPFFIRKGVQLMISPLKMQPFIYITVDEYMLGYEDPLVTLANTFLSKTIPFSKLGLLDIIQHQNDTITMFIGPDDPARIDPKLYSIDMLNGSPGLEYWGYGKRFIETANGTTAPELLRCNTVQGTYEGVLLSRSYPLNETAWIFRKYCCRPLPTVFEKFVIQNGMKLRQYTLKDDAFETPDKNPDNTCYCEDDSSDCLPAGLAEVTPCYFNVPAAISFPHFYKADERLLQAVDGLSPDEEKHKSHFTISPDLGTPIEGHCKLQVNLIARTSEVRSLAAFHGMIIPLMWLDTVIGPYPDDMISMMRFAVNEGPILQKALAYLLLISGLSLLIVITVQHHFPLTHMRNKLNSFRFRQKNGA